MIEDPPALTIRRGFDRPAADVIERLRGTPTGHLVDALGGRGALGPQIKALAGDANVAFIGPALPCHAGPADNLAVLAALVEARAGDVIVAATEGFTATALIGDLVTGMAANRGVAAFVTDGTARDGAGILATGVPVFCTGVTPNSPANNGPGSVGLPVTIDGVVIQAGDIVVGDRDGVVVVPRDAAAATLARLEGVRAAEAEMEAKVAAGLEAPDLTTLYESDAVRFVE